MTQSLILGHLLLVDRLCAKREQRLKERLYVR